MNVYHEANKKHFKYGDCQKLFTRDTTSGITEKDFPYIYGMSKMTVALETQYHSSYYIIQMVEFLEIICRAADVRYAESIGVPLTTKVEFMLDELFKLVNFQRCEP